MTIKNLQLNAKMPSKIASLAITSSILVTSLTGCGLVKQNILSNRFLENTSVVTLSDGSKDIVITEQNPCRTSKYDHYNSIISGNYYANKDCTHQAINGEVNHHYDIASVENIYEYLTDEEISKLDEHKLSETEIKDIIVRIVSSHESKIK